MDEPQSSIPNANQSNPSGSHDVKVKPATFDGLNDKDYKAHFESDAKINGWSQIKKRPVLSCIIERPNAGCVR